MKDVIIDNCFAGKLNGKLTDVEKKFMLWLRDEGHLTVSDYLLTEYKGSFLGAAGNPFIVLYAHLMANARINKVNKDELREVVFKERTSKKFLSNKKDWNHIRLFVKSHRKMGLSLDKKFIRDVILNVKGSSVSSTVDGMPYSE